MSQAPLIIATLIDRFDQNRESYKSQSYNETQVRREFLDPLFEALGWDVAAALAPLYRAALMDFPATGINPRQVTVPLVP